jgi:membrane protease YdiL (CAAX protease family)
MTTDNYSPAQAPGATAGEPVTLEYHELLRGGRWASWRVLLGVPLALVAVVLVQSVPVVVWTIGLMAQGRSYDEVSEVATGGTVTPAFLAVVNLGWAFTIPVVLLVVWLMHRLRPGWVASVAGRIRWRFLIACFGLSFVALFANLLVSSLLPAQSGDSISGSLNDFTAQTRNFALVILLLTPLQAAGEEYAFRGYLTQAFGGLLAGLGPWVSRSVAVVVPALLFATAHGAGQGWPIFTDRFAFGVVAGILVIATGGLEAGIALHVLNNFLAFGIALAFGDMTSALNATGGSWWSLPSTLTQAVVYTALSIWMARRMGLATRTAPVVLAAPEPRV